MVTIIIFLLTIINNPILIVSSQRQSQPPSKFHIPIKKDENTLQHYAALQIGTPPIEIDAVIDLAGNFLSLACQLHDSSTRRRVNCNSTFCQTLVNPPTCKDNKTKCHVSSINPFAEETKGISVISGELNRDLITLHETDGSSALIATRSERISFECVDRHVAGLAGSSAGILGLAGNFPASLFSSYNIAPKFALCLPSSNDLGFGDLFIGGGPYVFPGGVNAGEWLSLTPLTKPNKISQGYSVSAKSIKIDRKTVSRARSTVEISTSTRYGVLESSLFRAVVGEFEKRSSARNISIVPAIKPFGACFGAEGIRWTRSGPRVPVMEIELEGKMKSVVWRVEGGNSMVRVSEKVMCLGFVDGGHEARVSMVLGGLQIEDNFLEFDFSTSLLGFSSSILPRGVGCSNYRNQ